MQKYFLAAAAALFAGAAALSPAGAADSYYLLSVDILGDNGGVTLHKQVKCPRYDDCREKLPVVIEGKPQTLFVMARVQDEHHIYVTADTGISPSSGFRQRGQRVLHGGHVEAGRLQPCDHLGAAGAVGE